MLPRVLDWLAEFPVAMRVLRTRRRWAAGIIVSIALGIGANVAAFTVFRSLLVAPEPYAQPDRLVQIGLVVPHAVSFQPLSAAEYALLGSRVPSLQMVAGCTWRPGVAVGGVGAGRVLVDSVTPDFFTFFGVRPVLGRIFDIGDFAPGQRVAVISSDVWRLEFDGDHNVVGRDLRIDGQPWTIIGVMPPRFAPPCSAHRTDNLWVPGSFAPAAAGPPHPGAGPAFLSTFGRLSAGASAGEARVQIEPLVRSVRDSRPVAGVHLEEYGQSDRAGAAPSVDLIDGIAVALWFATCISVVNLFAARAAERREEFMMRTALGATGPRLVWHAAAEGVVIIGIGAVCSVLVAYVMLSRLVPSAAQLLPPDSPVTLGVLSLSPAVFLGLFTMVIASAVAGFALRPSVTHAARYTVTAGRRLLRVRAVLLTAEVAVATIAVVVVGLLLRSFAIIAAQPLGFNAAHLVVADVLMANRSADAWRLAASLDGGLRARLGQVDMAFASDMPFGGQGSLSVAVPPAVPWDDATLVWRNSAIETVSTSYFRTLQIPVLEGRGFSEADADGGQSAAVIVNRRFVEDGGIRGSPIGRTVLVGASVFRVVGEVANVRTSATFAPRATIYLPLGHKPLSQLSVAVRTRDLRGAEQTLGSEVGDFDPNLAVLGVQTMPDRIGKTEDLRRFYLQLVGLVALLAGLLALAGVYGMSAYLRRVRAREMAVRAALGATPAKIRGLMLREGCWIAVSGVACGMIASWYLVSVLATRSILGAQLYQVTPHDVLTFCGAAAFSSALLLTASWLPSVGATASLKMALLLRDQ